MKTFKNLRVGLGLLVLALSAAAAEVPCYPGSEFAQRRERLLAEAGDGVILIDAATFPSEFFYLTGVKSRTAKLIIIPDQIAKSTPKPEVWKTTIYLPPKSARAGIWDDPVLSAGDDTITPTGIQNNAPEGEFMNDLTAKIGLIAETFYIPFRTFVTDPERLPEDLKFVDMVRKALPQVKVKNLLPILEWMRWRKTPAEIEVMRRACAITTEAFQEAARYTKPGIYEYEIEALIGYLFRRQGSEEPAFLIIGSGPNSCVLHHMKNDRRMEENELLVVDIGTVYCSLSNDLTRTIPTSGKYTAEQKAIYEIVLKAQKAAIAIVKPGVTLAQVHQTARKIIEAAGYGKYFIHGTSHSLNGGNEFNVLNLGTLRSREPFDRYLANDVPLEPGSMFTIEPGIYIPEKKLGVRIEDSVLVTGDGYEILTAAAPKEIAEVEELMKQKPLYLKK
jgi:Xaa-Pro aminopeptidase